MVPDSLVPVAARMNISIYKALLIAGALALFVALGIWQLNRAQEKEIIRDRILARSSMPPIELGATTVVTAEDFFRKARATGRYLTEYQVFLDNKVHQGRAGLHVLTPLRIRGSDALLLVNRGWTPWGMDRQKAPVAVPPAEEVTVTGQLSIPVPNPITLGTDGAPEGFARVWQNFDMDRYQSLVGAPVIGLVMELESASEMADLVREWPRNEDAWIKRHQAYAIQWFGIAALFIVIVIFSQRRKKDSE